MLCLDYIKIASDQIWPRFLRYQSLSCLMLFSSTVGAMSSFLPKVSLDQNPVFLFISLSTQNFFLSSSISLNFPLSYRSFIPISLSLASHSLLLEFSYISLVISFNFQDCSYYISLMRDYYHFLWRSWSSQRYCCSFNRSCQSYMSLRRSWDYYSKWRLCFYSIYSSRVLSFFVYFSQSYRYFLQTLAYWSATFLRYRSRSFRLRIFSSLNYFSLVYNLLISYWMYFSFSWVNSQNILFWLAFTCLSSQYLAPLLRSSSSAFSKALSPSSNFRFASENSLSQSFLQFRNLSCISQNSFSFSISSVFSQSFLVISSWCWALSLSTSFLCAYRSSFNNFSLNCLWSCSCSSSIFLSSLVSATKFSCFGSSLYGYLLNSLVCSRGLTVGGVTVSVGAGAEMLLKGSISSLARLKSAKEDTDLFSSFLRLATDLLSSFLLARGGFILPAPMAGASSTSSSCQQLSFNFAFLFSLGGSFAQKVTSFLSFLAYILFSCLTSGSQFCFLMRSSKDMASFLVSLWICNKLVAGLSWGNG